MATLNMNGSYDLTIVEINKIITRKSAGNYALGYMSDGAFVVEYVGRSDSDLNKRLKDWVGHYKKFKYSYAGSPKAAFEKECENYHDFGEKERLNNDIHPARPDDSSWKCPNCDTFK